VTPAEQQADTVRPYSLHYAGHEPKCGCKPSTSWAMRRYDGVYEDGVVEMRTCLQCGFTLSRVIR
jgi:hypothetical protein